MLRKSITSLVFLILWFLLAARCLDRRLLVLCGVCWFLKKGRGSGASFLAAPAQTKTVLPRSMVKLSPLTKTTQSPGQATRESVVCAVSAAAGLGERWHAPSPVLAATCRAVPPCRLLAGWLGAGRMATAAPRNGPSAMVSDCGSLRLGR